MIKRIKPLLTLTSWEFFFFNSSLIISPSHPYLFTSKYMLPLHFHEGDGGRKDTVFSLRYRFSVWHTVHCKKQTALMRAVVQLLHPVSVTQLPQAVPSPLQGQCQREWGAGHVPHPLQLPPSPPVGPSRQGTVPGSSVQTLPRLAAAEPGSLHPLLCLHRTTSRGGKVTSYDFTPREAARQRPR